MRCSLESARLQKKLPACESSGLSAFVLCIVLLVISAFLMGFYIGVVLKKAEYEKLISAFLTKEVEILTKNQIPEDLAASHPVTTLHLELERCASVEQSDNPFYFR